VLENLTPEGKGGAIAGLLFLGLAILRKIGLRASKDMITLSADAADRDAYTRLLNRVEELDGRLADVELARNQMFGFTTKCMAYIAQCQCEGVMPPTKSELQEEYQKLIRALADGFKKKEEGD
jgi:hypothetical protein